MNLQGPAFMIGLTLMLGALVSCSNGSYTADDHDQTVAENTSTPDKIVTPEELDLRSNTPQSAEDSPSELHLRDGVANTSADENLLATYACGDESCSNSIFDANSASEASWLKSRGYPPAKWVGKLNKMSDSQLAVEAERGDLGAQAILGRRLIEAGNKSEGLVRLNAASVKGSVFADFQLSEAFRKSDLIESAAYLRRAYLQGDTKAARMIHVEFPEFSATELVLVDERAMDLYRGLLAQRAGKGRYQVGPRPN